MFAKSFIFVSLLAALVSTANAFSSGAAGCSGDAMVGGPHVDNSTKTVEVTSWAAAKLVLKVNGKTYAPGAKITVTAGVSNIMEVSSSTNFKGFLFRFIKEGEYTGLDVLAKLGSQVAVGCKGLIYRGITHLDGVDKKRGTGGFILKTVPAEEIKFTTTVVYSNSDTLSKYAYADWSIKAVPAKPCKPKTCSFIQNFFGCTTKYCD